MSQMHWREDPGNDIRVFYNVIPGRLSIANVMGKPGTDQLHYFSTAGYLEYEPFCDDFGPMNISSVASFIEMLDQHMDMCPSSNVVYLVQRGRRPFTNGVFLIGAYMVLQLNMDPDEVWDRFQNLDLQVLEPFRDATFMPADFGISGLDCWQAMKRAVDLGWLKCPSQPGLWGMINIEEYDRLENPLHGDVVQVVPGKFIAFKGPRDLDGRQFSDERGFREFSPSYYADLFAKLNVGAVVRLNEATSYDRSTFQRAGIQHFDLPFDDCTAPPRHVVADFFRVADAAARAGHAVAVHCRAGLGRTGTLIALDMMRVHGFTAREAIAWLRIMRPGSVIGEQQQYLCRIEAAGVFAGGGGGGGQSATASASAPPLAVTAAPVHGRRSLPALSSCRAEAAGRQVAAAVDRRAAAAGAVGTPSPSRPGQWQPLTGSTSPSPARQLEFASGGSRLVLSGPASMARPVRVLTPRATRSASDSDDRVHAGRRPSAAAAAPAAGALAALPGLTAKGMTPAAVAAAAANLRVTGSSESFRVGGGPAAAAARAGDWDSDAAAGGVRLGIDSESARDFKLAVDVLPAQPFQFESLARGGRQTAAAAVRLGFAGRSAAGATSTASQARAVRGPGPSGPGPESGPGKSRNRCQGSESGVPARQPAAPSSESDSDSTSTLCCRGRQHPHHDVIAAAAAATQAADTAAAAAAASEAATCTGTSGPAGGPGSCDRGGAPGPGPARRAGALSAGADAVGPGAAATPPLTQAGSPGPGPGPATTRLPARSAGGRVSAAGAQSSLRSSAAPLAPLVGAPPPPGGLFSPGPDSELLIVGSLNRPGPPRHSESESSEPLPPAPGATASRPSPIPSPTCQWSHPGAAAPAAAASLRGLGPGVRLGAQGRPGPGVHP